MIVLDFFLLGLYYFSCIKSIEKVIIPLKADKSPKIAYILFIKIDKNKIYSDLFNSYNKINNF